MPWYYEMCKDADTADGAKKFALFPLADFHARNVPIDNCVMFYALRFAYGDGPPENFPKTREEFIAAPDQWWKATFDIKHVRTCMETDSRGFQFRKYMMTNGVSVNFLFARNKTKDEIDWAATEALELLGLGVCRLG